MQEYLRLQLIALADLSDLPVLCYPFGSFSDLVWELRRNLTSYDAWYVALAEELDVPLLTLDRRLRRGSGAEVRGSPGVNGTESR